MSAFEKVLFEVYHRSLESLTAGLLLRQNDSAQGRAPRRRCRKDCFSFCRALQYVFVLLFVLATAALIKLHLTFGGQAGCLRSLVHTAVCADDGSQYHHVNGGDDTLLAAAAAAEALVHPAVRDTFGADLVSAAVAPPIRSESNGLSTRRSNSTMQSSNISNNGSMCAGLLAKDSVVYVYFERDLPFAASSSSALGTSRNSSQMPTSAASRSDGDAELVSQRNDKQSPIHTTFNRSLARYEWSQVAGVLALPLEMRADHNFTTYDVFLDDESCGTSAYSLLFTTWQDTAMINMFMYSLHTDGSLVNKQTNETFRWHRADTLSKTTVVDVVVSKLTVLVAIALGFISLSAVTGVVVRVLIADGTLVIAATAQVLRLCVPRLGITTEMAVRPYPWLYERIFFIERGQRHGALDAFFIAHVGFLMFMYMMYEATQFTWTFWFYLKSFPEDMPLWVLLWVFSAEYFVMIFARSRVTIRFFPRYHALIWLAFHLYFYATGYGFYLLAAQMAVAANFALIIHLLLDAEIPAVVDGSVSEHRPRQQYVSILGPAWESELPPMWSMFHPLNATASPDPRQEVPNIFGQPEDESFGEQSDVSYERHHDDDSDSLSTPTNSP